MANITMLMVYFPLVIVGLGQVLIVGMSPARRVLHDAANARTWGAIHSKFGESRKTQCDVVDKRAAARLPQLPRRPVVGLPRIGRGV
ncbi:MAG: hypothetical protein ACT4O4_10055 [Nitrospiraceae bacterium]